MEIIDKFTQLEEVSIDKVCRTCLNTSDDPMVTLYDQDEEEKMNFFEMLTECFGKIVPSHQNLPSGLCEECKDLIRKSYDFRTRCMRSNEILLGSYEQSKISLQESKETQTENELLDDEDHQYEMITAQDMNFEGSENPLMDIQQNIQEGEIEALEDEEIEEATQEAQNEESIEPKKAHTCSVCNKSFIRIAHLKRHLLTHEETKPMQCDMCDKAFSRHDHLKQHMLNSHSDSKPFHCNIENCKKKFLKKDKLDKHIQAKHINESQFCELCQKSFTSKKYLRIHMRVHNGEKIPTKKDLEHEKPYLCSECGLRFVRNDYLVVHMRRHLGLKPYKCKYCDKGFPRATDLTVHERYHTNEKTHLCNQCGKGFQRAYNLLVHMRVHTGEKPYECSYCSKCFSQGNDLKAHVRRHTGERFKCDLCSEGFIQGYHLTQHKRTVHGLDVKSHIRRVTKFASAAESETQGAIATILKVETTDNFQTTPMN